jgi:eukaryotic-like serine/threonine-protein kinase
MFARMRDQLDRLQSALADRYSIERQLGSGGMATVYLAKDLRHDRSVAVKVLRPELTAALGAERFLREVQITARLQHPHILTLIDSGAQDNILYYVMPYVEGESLRDHLNRERQLPIEEAIQITREVADGLSYAHAHRVVHRDIKPENILLSGGHAIVADFGIARAISAAGIGNLTETGLSVGTPAYMSPEQATGSKQLDGRTDVYSLACVLYEMLTGDPPFTGKTGQAIIARALVDPPPRLRTVRPTVSATVEQAVTKALSKVPADRFSSASQFAEALTATTAVRGSDLGPRRRLRNAVAVTLVSLLVVSAGLAAFSYSRRARRSAGVSGRNPSLVPQRIAVLYFQDLSNTHDLGYLADGLTDALIDTLGRVRLLGVISKDGVNRYRDPGIPRDSIARALGVGALVEGRLERVAAGVRITVWVVDGATGVESSRQSFEGSPADVFSLRGRLADEVLRLLPAMPSGRASAWILVQRARQANKDAETSSDTAVASRSFERADSLLQKAELRDPTWIEPIYLRGWVASNRARMAKDEQHAAPWTDEGMGHVARALALAPGDAKALELRGMLRYRHWRWTQSSGDSPAAAALLDSAEEDLRAAVRADSSLASAWSTLSSLDYRRQDIVAANRDARRSEEADPNFRANDAVLSRLFNASYDLELFEPATDWCNKGRRRFPSDPRFVECQLMLMTSKAADPDVGLAWRLADEVVRLTPERDRSLKRLHQQVWVAFVLGRAGLADSARHVLDRSKGRPATDPGRELLALVAAARLSLGDNEEALQLLEQYFEINPTHRAHFRGKVYWWWRGLEDDPRFKALVSADR